MGANGPILCDLQVQADTRVDRWIQISSICKDSSVWFRETSDRSLGAMHLGYESFCLLVPRIFSHFLKLE